jgi:hypothetical protein
VKVVTVSRQGTPVTTLRANAFRLEEDGHPLDPNIVALRLLPTEDVLNYHTVLLVDLGAYPTAKERKRFLEGANRFIEKLRGRQSVTVLGFDGSEHTRVLGDYARNVSTSETALAESRFTKGSDPSRNLHGAVLEGLERLEAKLKRPGNAVHVGNLVVFTAGPDLAGRVSEETVESRLAQSQHNLYVVGLQEHTQGDVLRRLARNGEALAPDLLHVPEAFDEAFALISANLNSHYVLSFCSLARGGQRRVRVAVDVVSDTLEVETDTLDTEYDATGFTKGCDASVPPRLSPFKTVAKN